MSRRIFVPGCNFDGTRNGNLRGSAASGELSDTYRGPLPENPLAAEFFAARKPTSHSGTGIDAGDFLHHRGAVARVEGEQRDQHSGRIEQFVQVSDRNGSGTRKLTWEPDGPRGMRVTSDKRVHE